LVIGESWWRWYLVILVLIVFVTVVSECNFTRYWCSGGIMFGFGVGNWLLLVSRGMVVIVIAMRRWDIYFYRDGDW